MPEIAKSSTSTIGAENAGLGGVKVVSVIWLNGEAV